MFVEVLAMMITVKYVHFEAKAIRFLQNGVLWTIWMWLNKERFEGVEMKHFQRHLNTTLEAAGNEIEFCWYD